MVLNRGNITSLCGFEHSSMLMNTCIINVKEPVIDFQVTGITGNNVLFNESAGSAVIYIQVPPEMFII